MIRASSFPVLSGPRYFSDLQTSAASALKHSGGGTTFSSKDHVGITPSYFFLLQMTYPFENSEMAPWLRLTAIGSHCSFGSVPYPSGVLW